MVIFKGVVAYRVDETYLKLSLSFNLGANKEQKSKKSKIEYQFNGKQQEVAFEISNNYFNLLLNMHCIDLVNYLLPILNKREKSYLLPI